MEREITRGGGKVPVIVTAAVALAGLAALVAGSLSQLTIPGADIAEAVRGCGGMTGRDIDKISRFSIEMQEVANSGIQIPLHSRVAIQCELKEFVKTGEGDV